MITVKELLEYALGACLGTAIGLWFYSIRLEQERKRYIEEMEEERRKILERPDGEKQKPNIF